MKIVIATKSVINLCINENGLGIKNPFIGIYLPNSEGIKPRYPISLNNYPEL